MSDNKSPAIKAAIPSFNDFEIEEQENKIQSFNTLKEGSIYYVKPCDFIQGKYGKSLVIEVFEVVNGKVSSEGFKIFTPKSYTAKMLNQYKNCKSHHWILYNGMKKEDNKNVYDYVLRRTKASNPK